MGRFYGANGPTEVHHEAKAVGVYVFGGGIDEAVPPVLVSADGAVAEGGYPWHAVRRMFHHPRTSRDSHAVARARRQGLVVRGRLHRIHEIANAGVPVVDIVDRRGPKPTWAIRDDVARAS